MEEKGWVYNDPAATAYLEKVALPLVPKQTPEHVTWHFRVLRDIEVNAFALPNGSIYVNSGLLARLENEAQLAGVLAHEITHVNNRHTYLEYRSIRKKAVAINIMVAAASAAYYAGVNPGIVNAMGNLLPMIVISTVFGYSRELEHESDTYAVNILNAQGYDLNEFARGFELLKKGPEVDLSQESVFWASHPKLSDRVTYVTGMANQLQPKSTGLRTAAANYRAGTRSAIRHEADLDMMFGRPRTAVSIAQRLISLEPDQAGHYALLGDAYRSLGARTVVPTDEEQSDQGKSQARKRLRKMTLIEYDKALLSDPKGAENWQQNCRSSEKAFHKALEIDSKNAEAYRGLGFLQEQQGHSSAAAESFQKYLELAPTASDTRRIRMHIESLQKQAALPVPVEANKR